MSPYIPLWCKSNFSFLVGASHPDELVEKARRLGLPAMALTDDHLEANFGMTSFAMISIESRIFFCSKVAKFIMKMM